MRAASYGTWRSPFTNFKASFCTFSSDSSIKDTSRLCRLIHYATECGRIIWQEKPKVKDYVPYRRPWIQTGKTFFRLKITLTREVGILSSCYCKHNCQAPELLVHSARSERLVQETTRGFIRKCCQVANTLFFLHKNVKFIKSDRLVHVSPLYVYLTSVMPTIFSKFLLYKTPPTWLLRWK